MTDDGPMLRSLKAAADPALAPGAAGRIAAGAWERAAAARAHAAPRFRALRRTGVAAAAAVLVAAVVLAVRGTDPAFAVEGDPVMVERGGEWVSTRTVALDNVVRVPEGMRVMRWSAGGTLRPHPGSLLRFVRGEGAAPAIRVEFEEGGGDVEGATFVVATRDVVVERDPSAATFSFHIAIDPGQGGPRVSMDSGRGFVRAVATQERLLLHSAERAALLPVSLDGRRTLRLTKVENWSGESAARITSGRFAVMDAGFGPRDGITLFGTSAPRGAPAGASPGFLAIDVPGPQVRDAVSRVNVLGTRRMTWNVAVRASHPASRFIYEKDGERVEVDVLASGAVAVKGVSEFRRYADVDTFFREAPQTAALFGDSIPR